MPLSLPRFRQIRPSNGSLIYAASSIRPISLWSGWTAYQLSFRKFQFESIHPILDGNGRLGRLLITLLLCEQKILREPLLYLSLYFKTHRQYYYELLNNVRLTGDWEAWLHFFAEAVIATATQAVDLTASIRDS